ncbi:MAG: DNA adenine methylase [Bacilli bacterium]|jgi:DNA adenine methylase|nr:DNA adenine methylase [Bacilli bacterium]
MKPFIKWAGGKRQLVPILKENMPKHYNQYYEPFIGGGALFFEIAPNKAHINDYNKDLVTTYIEIRDNLDELINLLKKYKENNNKEFYLKIREQDRTSFYNQISDTKKAARLLYMLRVCWNGLYRVNSKNQFNVPYGTYKNPKIVDKELLSEISMYLNNNDIKITNLDFEEAVKNAKKGDFVYFDPPYMPISETSAFTSYTKKGFDYDEQLRLRDLFKELDSKGVNVMLSNSLTKEILDLYKDYEKTTIIVDVNRLISSKKSSRGVVQEVIIKNY